MTPNASTSTRTTGVPTDTTLIVCVPTVDHVFAYATHWYAVGPLERSMVATFEPSIQTSTVPRVVARVVTNDRLRAVVVYDAQAPAAPRNRCEPPEYAE